MKEALSEVDGVMKMRPELMEDEVLYHCIVGQRLMLAYRDSQKVMHCYEVEEPRIVGAVRACASYGEASFLLEQIGAGGVNNVIKQANEVDVPMSANDDAAQIYTEYKERKSPDDASSPPPAAEPAAAEAQPEPRAETPPQESGQPSGAPDSEPPRDERPAETPGDGASSKQGGEPRDRSVILIGIKPIMTYVTATLTQLATLPKITIKSRGKRITQAVDVSQMIVKRMNTVGYKIADVRISSDSFTGEDGRDRKISTMEIDITKS